MSWLTAARRKDDLELHWRAIERVQAEHRADVLHYVGLWSSDEVIIGYIGAANIDAPHGKGGAHLRKVAWREDGPCLLPGRIIEARRLVGVMRHSAGWLMAAASGEIWWHARDGDSPVLLEWQLPGEDDPELIIDASPANHDGSTASREMFVTTNIGAFSLRVDPAGERPVRTVPLTRSGHQGSAMAVTQFRLNTHGKEQAYLWSCESTGASFIAPINGEEERFATFRQMGAESSRSPAVRALAVRPRDAADQVWIWQTCRNDALRVSEYVSASGGLSEVQMDDARTWIRTNYSAVSLTASLSHQSSSSSVVPSAPSHEVPDPGDQERPSWSLVADLFEPPPGAARALWEFLTNPNPRLAIEALERREQPRALVVQCWTQALVGSILRLAPAEKDSLALGVIDWLRKLERYYRGRDAAVAEAIAECIFDVRRWTLFASDPDTLFAGVARQVRRLARQHQAYPVPREREELLARTAVLFRNRVDEESTLRPSRPARLGQAFAVATLRWSDEISFAAILWRHTKLVVYRIVDDQGGGDECELHEHAVISTFQHHRFGRGLALSRSSKGLLLMVSVKVERDGREFEVLRLYDVPASSSSVTPSYTEDDSPGVNEDDTIHAVKELDADTWALSGRFNHKAGVRLVERRGQRLHVGKVQEVPALYPTGVFPDSSVRNKHDAATCVAYDHSTRQIVVGCADGQVFAFPVAASTTLVLGAKESRLEEGTLVGRLAVPVWTVACRSTQSDDGADHRFRVYAGGADGHVMAWQGLSRPAGGEKAAENTRYASLWATREQDAIVALWCTQLALERNRAGDLIEIPVVVATSRNGRTVIFWDKDCVEASNDPRPIRRPRVPGQRLERYVLQDSVVAAGALPRPPVRPAGNDSIEEPHRHAVARLLTVTARNNIRVLSLFQPKRSTLRVEAYEELLRWWKQATFGPSDAGTPSGLGLRYPDALRATAPDLWMLSIRKLLPVPDESGHADVLPDVIAWHYPIAVRPFAEAAAAFRTWNDARTRENERAFVRKLRTSLEQAVIHRDRMLFKEITDTVLRRMNHLIVEACKEGALQPELSLDLYAGVVTVLEESCRFWTGVDPEAYARVQMARIKSLVDGDVFRALTRFRASQPPPADIARGTRGPFAETVNLRVAQVHNLLLDGDALVRLEALRAVNLSLIRATWLALHSGDAIESREGVLALLEPLGSFASQAAASADTAMLHEIARCYALSVFASPEAAIDVALGLHKARVPAQVLDEVRNQLDLLYFWFDAAATKDSSRNAIADARMAFASMRDTDSIRAWIIQRPSRERYWHWWEAYGGCGRVVAAIEELTRALTTEPERGTLDPLLSKELRKLVIPASRTLRVRAITEPPKPVTFSLPEMLHHFRSHYAFWRNALWSLHVTLRDLLTSRASPTSSAAPASSSDRSQQEAVVKPEVVLVSAHVARWARSQIEELDGQYASRQVHDPHYQVYRQALSGLEVAMLGLPRSAAVQKALVVGVLGHHLLENLDNQVFQLLQLSRVLCPDEGLEADTARLMPGEADRLGTVDRFAAELRDQAAVARHPPKNLRTLSYLLESMGIATAAAPTKAGTRALSKLVERSLPGEREPLDGMIDADHEPFLEIILRELANNHVQHGDKDRAVGVSSYSNDGAVERMTITLPFRYDGDGPDDKWGRIIRLVESQLQEFIAPAVTPGSNGTGFYLAQLAASVIGWRLRISTCTGEQFEGGRCSFVVSVERTVAQEAAPAGVA